MSYDANGWGEYAMRRHAIAPAVRRRRPLPRKHLSGVVGDPEPSKPIDERPWRLARPEDFMGHPSEPEPDDLFCEEPSWLP
jgi:hypothetical protein